MLFLLFPGMPFANRRLAVFEVLQNRIDPLLILVSDHFQFCSQAPAFEQLDGFILLETRLLILLILVQDPQAFTQEPNCRIIWVSSIRIREVLGKRLPSTKMRWKSTRTFRRRSSTWGMFPTPRVRRTQHATTGFERSN